MEKIHHKEKEQFKRLFENEGIDRIEDRLAVLGVFLGIERHMTFEELMAALRENGYDFSPDFVKKTPPPTEKELKVLRGEVDPLRYIIGRQ